MNLRAILHCDLNNFFASVECLKNPSLRNVPMVVAGDPNKRHGIVVAKNELAKKYGIYTPETVYSALKKCKNLVVVESSYEDYKKYSKIVNNIYLEYTDKVEPFGIDESFLDITESLSLFGSPEEIANKIKEEVKQKTGLTISVGVSFNKSLAKLGSDLKKPDAVTVLSYDNFKEKIYDLPVNSLLYVGKNTYNKLLDMRIKTIGDLACSNKKYVISKLGKTGEIIHNYANGIDNDEVLPYENKYTPKSISHGITFNEDTDDFDFVLKIIRKISSKISTKLRVQMLKCSEVSLNIKYEDFVCVSRQRKLDLTDLYKDIVNCAQNLFLDNVDSTKKVRAITVGISGFEDEDIKQINLFDDICKKDENKKLEDVNKVLDEMKKIYGDDKINFASTL